MNGLFSNDTRKYCSRYENIFLYHSQSHSYINIGVENLKTKLGFDANHFEIVEASRRGGRID